MRSPHGVSNIQSFVARKSYVQPPSNSLHGRQRGGVCSCVHPSASRRSVNLFGFMLLASHFYQIPLHGRIPKKFSILSRRSFLSMEYSLQMQSSQTWYFRYPRAFATLSSQVFISLPQVGHGYPSLRPFIPRTPFPSSRALFSHLPSTEPKFLP